MIRAETRERLHLATSGASAAVSDESGESRDALIKGSTTDDDSNERRAVHAGGWCVRALGSIIQ